MKTKVFFFISLCAIGLCVLKVQATCLETTPIRYLEKNLPDGYDEIYLHGELMFNAGAIEAGASDDAVYIQFNQSFGNVDISIYSSSGALAYNTVVNTNVQTVVIIPFTAANTGSYTVFLENATGYAEGDFDHD